MSQLVAISHTIVDKIALGQRVHEIMVDKGKYYSISAMSKRIGICSETYRKMIKGDREIYNFELEKMAKDLKLPISRILQEDTHAKVKTLRTLLANKSSLTEAMEIADELLLGSIGLTERCNALNNLARVHFYLGQYGESYEIWTKAYELAVKISKKYKDTDRLFIILSNLMALFTARKQYSHLEDVLKRIDGVFDNQPEKLGSIYFSKAMLSEHFGNTEQAGEYMYRALECLRESGHENKLGRAELNVAFFEYKSRNYSRAKSHIEKAIIHLQSDDSTKVIAIKEYVKILIKLGELELAAEEIGRTIGSVENPNLYAKFQLLLSVAKDDPTIAEGALTLELSEKLRLLICKHLIQHYYLNGDSEAALRYYGVIASLSTYNADVMHEEDI